MKDIFKKVLIFLFIIGIIGIYLLLFLIYGPKVSFRDWLINTSMATMSHQNIAKFFFDEETINDSLKNNSIKEFTFDSNLEEIEFINYSEIPKIEYENEYEEQILSKSNSNNDYKIIKISGEKYDGYLAAIYEPSRISVAVTNYFGKDGQYLTKMAEQNNAFVAITGGGFVDPNGHGTGGEPLGITITNGKLLHETPYDKTRMMGGIVGITYDDKLYLGDITSKQALDMGIRDCVSFGPYLIVNGVNAKIEGIAGGRSPRTAIGQRKDGIFLFLVLDGDRTLGRGATYQDVLEIMERYGAYNASCLDGGTSAGMVVKNKLINNPVSQSGQHRTRPISTAFIFNSDENDMGDYSVVREKIDY